MHRLTLALALAAALAFACGNPKESALMEGVMTIAYDDGGDDDVIVFEFDADEVDVSDQDGTVETWFSPYDTRPEGELTVWLNDEPCQCDPEDEDDDELCLYRNTDYEARWRKEWFSGPSELRAACDGWEFRIAFQPIEGYPENWSDGEVWDDRDWLLTYTIRDEDGEIIYDDEDDDAEPLDEERVQVEFFFLEDDPKDRTEDD